MRFNPASKQLKQGIGFASLSFEEKCGLRQNRFAGQQRRAK
jgi:hypothetical protein